MVLALPDFLKLKQEGRDVSYRSAPRIKYPLGNFGNEEVAKFLTPPLVN
jgi:hypothetical protein